MRFQTSKWHPPVTHLLKLPPPGQFFDNPFSLFQVEIYASFLHDAVFLYAYALNKTLTNNQDSRNASIIMGYIFNSSFVGKTTSNRPFSYSTKESGSSGIFIHFIRQVRSSGVRGCYGHCAHSKIFQNVNKRRSIEILFQNS